MLSGTGHLCLATLHANNAAETLDRVINMFPRDQHTQMCLDLSQYLRAIIAQRLVPGKDGKRCRRHRDADQHAARAGADQEGRRDRREGSAGAQREKGMQRFDVALLPAATRQGSPSKTRSPMPIRARTSRRRSISAERSVASGASSVHRVPPHVRHQSTRSDPVWPCPPAASDPTRSGASSEATVRGPLRMPGSSHSGPQGGPRIDGATYFHGCARYGCRGKIRAGPRGMVRPWNRSVESPNDRRQRSGSRSGDLPRGRSLLWYPPARTEGTHRRRHPVRILA